MNTINPEKMSEQAKATIRHGIWIWDKASELYRRKGVPLPLDVTLLGDQRISYEVGISKDYGTDPFNRMVGSICRGLGGRAIRGVNLHTKQTDLRLPRGEGYSFLTRKNMIGDYGTTVFQRTGERDIVGEIVDAPDIAEAYHNSFQALTPDNIIIEQRGELTDHEQGQLFHGMHEDFSAIMKALKVPEATYTANGAATSFKLPGDATARMRYIKHGLQNLATGKVSEGCIISLGVYRRGDSYPKVDLSSFALSVGWSVNAQVMVDRTGRSTPVYHDDIIQLSHLMHELAASADCGRFTIPGGQDRSHSSLFVDPLVNDLGSYLQPSVVLSEASEEVVNRLLGQQNPPRIQQGY